MCLLQCAAFCCGVWPSVWCAVCIAVFVAMRVAVCCSHVIKLLHQGLEKGWFTERYHCKHPKHCNTLQHAATRCNTPKDKTDDKILSAKHCKASLYRTTAACHCSMSLQHAPATRTPLLQHAHFYSNVSLQHTYHHCNTHSITAACAPTFTPSQHRVTVTLQYNAQKWYTRVLQRVGIYHTATRCSMIVYIMLQCNVHTVRAILSDDLL